jgi:phosphatidate cytidylyltransferase
LLTAIVALPLLILLIIKGSAFLFSCFIALVSMIGLTEFYRMALPERRIAGTLAAVFGGCFSLLLARPDLAGFTFACNDRLSFPIFMIALFFLASGSTLLFSIKDIRNSAAEIALIGMGFTYVPLLLTHLAWLRALPNGMQWVFLLLVIVMAGDTFAYYVGCNFGRRKLYPIVSPNKSVEGALGGLVGSICGALLAKATFFPALALHDCFATALLMGPLGQIGDLFESMLKRSFGVKDSGVIIPGHGGILDRLDSILFAAPAAFYYAYFIFLP